jgi:hypothetical protein
MSTLAVKRIRLALNLASADKPVDMLTGGQPHHWVNNDLQIEVTAIEGDIKDESSQVLDISSVASLTIQVRDSVGGDLVFPEKTVSALNLDNAVTRETLLDGTKQHCTFTFTHEETDVDLNDAVRVDLVWAIKAVTNDTVPKEITWGVGLLTIENDGYGAGSAPAPNDPNYLTSSQTQAQIEAFAGRIWDQDAQAWRQQQVKNGQIILGSIIS